MKKLLIVFVVLFSFQNLLSQTIKEKKLYEGSNMEIYSLYDFKYHEKTGSYLYSKSDTVTYRSKIISNKGNSVEYYNASTYAAQFDNAGNYYLTASNNINETKNIYYFIKNGVELRQYENIKEPISMNGSNIYFAASEKGKDFLVKYNTLTGDFENGPAYDTINYVFIKSLQYYEGEPSFEIGFTKDGSPFYHASNNGKHMMVVGNTELKKYDYIELYNVTLDNIGDICYTGVNVVDGKNEYYLVQGDREYGKYTNIIMPVVFDAANVPVFSASDAPGDYPSEQFVVRGSEKISGRFNRGVYDILITPSGKIAYNGNDTLPDGSLVNMLFVDGKEVAKFSSIFDIKFKNNDVPVFVGGTNNESFVVEGNKIISDKYGYVFDLTVTKDGIISYTGINYGDNEKNIPDQYYFVYGKKKHGPFKDIMMTERMDNQVVFNDKGDYAYTAFVTKPGKEYDITKFFVSGNDWKSDKYDGAMDLCSYKNDFYYTCMNYYDNGKSEQQVFKNDEKIGNEFELITNFSLDKEKGVLMYYGIKKSKIYLVTVTL